MFVHDQGNAPAPPSIRHRVMALAATAAALLLWPEGALACPDCRLGREVRARVVSEGFWFNLLVTILPGVLTAAVALALSRIGRPTSSKAAGR